ncbi:hypothetical protein LCGC14_0734690 [marine sediment metagenome]|uniref:Uncharacterized protein n=1 Tax=marine sediment metagenome TaxID=412755 RepID=A0A0F9QTJ2_9ZZZZ
MSETACKQVTCMDCCGRGVIQNWGMKDITATHEVERGPDMRCERCHGTGKIASFASVESETGGDDA